jgi:hypothetical protein
MSTKVMQVCSTSIHYLFVLPWEYLETTIRLPFPPLRQQVCSIPVCFGCKFVHTRVLTHFDLSATYVSQYHRNGVNEYTGEVKSVAYENM